MILDPLARLQHPACRRQVRSPGSSTIGRVPVCTRVPSRAFHAPGDAQATLLPVPIAEPFAPRGSGTRRSLSRSPAGRDLAVREWNWLGQNLPCELFSHRQRQAKFSGHKVFRELVNVSSKKSAGELRVLGCALAVAEMLPDNGQSGY